jgi:hypothetical protein
VSRRSKTERRGTHPRPRGAAPASGYPASGYPARGQPARGQPARKSTRIHIPERDWLAAGLLALIALLWACRGAPLGTAVADDYSFLYHLAFHHPLDPFDSMGATYYWRPLSRQIYFSAVSGWLIHASWAALTINATVLAALFLTLFSAARRGFPPPVAAAIAVIPLLSEPARVLLDWPSGIQHLLASLGLALAIHEALAGRIVTASVAALGGMLSHESASLALPALPLIGWLRTRRRSETLRWGAAAALVGTVWGAGYAISRRHGVQLPPGTGASYPLDRLVPLFKRGIAAALNLEDLPRLAHDIVVAGYIAVLLLALVSLARRRTRAALRERGTVPLIALAAFFLALPPLGLLLPDWNAWRAWVPMLGLGVAVTTFLGLCSPWLAGGWVVLRLAALLAAPTAPSVVAKTAPLTVSDMSFPRLSRLQHTVDSARRALTAGHRELPRGAVVRYWNLPRMVRVAFQDSLAVRVWYHDPTVVWQTFGGGAGLTRRVDVMLEFADDVHDPASLIDTEAMHTFQRGGQALLENKVREADSLFIRATQHEAQHQGPFASSVAMNRAIVAFVQGDYARADTFSDQAFAMGGESADFWALRGQLAYIRGDREGARRAAEKSLRLNANQAQAKRIIEFLTRTGG